MKPNIIAYARFMALFLRIRLIHFVSRFPSLPGGILDEQTALMRRAQEILGEETLDQVTVAQARTNMRSTFQTLKKVGGLFENVHTVRDLDIPGPAGRIPARLYLPGTATGLPVFVFLHGGGWVIGDLDTADNMARFICKRAGCSVLSVDYRLAPEHPFPAAAEDAFAAVRWAVDHAEEINGDAKCVLVGGDSAGGTLSAVVAQMAGRENGFKLAGQVLFYAATNGATLDTPSYKEFGEKSLGLTAADMRWFMNHYMPDPEGWKRPMASPLLAKDLHGLAPALVVTAEFDVLRDEGEDYARRMEAAGVPVMLMRCNGMAHGFLSTIGLIRRSEIYFDQIIAEIRKMMVA
jgi:acetyl esterase